VPNSDYQKWQTSLQSVLGVRGNAKLTFNINDDRIVDLCDTGRVEVGPDGNPRGGNPNQNLFLPFPFDPPKIEESWIRYECWLEVETDQGVVTYRTLPRREELPARNTPIPDALRSSNTEIQRYVPPGNWTTPGGAPSSGGGFATPPPPPPPPTPGASIPVGRIAMDLIPQVPANRPAEVRTQQRTAPVMYIWLVGKAMRAQFPIPQPKMEEVAGVKPVACNRVDRGEGFGIYGNSVVPIFWATWRLRYVMPKLPEGVQLPMPRNPMLNPDR
jgi:hypothetical protein